MKQFHQSILVILSVLILGCAPETSVDSTLKVMTFNIRLNLPSDGDNAWPNRKEKAASMVRFYAPDLLGVQEAFQGQVHDLAERLPAYGWIGVGRDDGQQAGEYMAIFYLKSRFKVLNENTFWLSEHPERPGLGWDAAYNRVVTWAYFEDLSTGNKIYHFNTHFDNQGAVARTESAKLLLKQMTALGGEAPQILTGDFNCYPNTEPHAILTGSKLLSDARLISQTPHHGPSRTMNRFDLASLSSTEPPIDHVFVTAHFSVLKHGTLSDTFDGYFPSDHMPVLVQLDL